MRVLADPQAEKILNPDGAEIDRKHMPAMEARFTLPLQAGKAPIHVECLLVYLKDLPDGSIAVALRFTNFRKDGWAKLMRFVEESLEPQG